MIIENDNTKENDITKTTPHDERPRQPLPSDEEINAMHVHVCG